MQNTKDSDIKLGMHVRDKISGFEGIATAKIECLTGCNRIQISPRAKDKNTMPTDTFEVDISVVEVVDNGLYSPIPVIKTPRKTGAYGRMSRIRS